MVSAPVPVGVGLPGMTYMGRRVLALPFIRRSSLPHEVLHNWWGNAVEVDYASGNWSEGLTTYMADHALAPNGGRNLRLGLLRNFAALPSMRDAALTDFTSRPHDASQVVGYGKTAMVFHMLKTRLGDEVFTQALQAFYKNMRARTAGWVDVQSAFEAASGEDLSAFFKAWLTRPGAPALKLIEAHVLGPHLTFTLSETDDGDGYALAVPVHVETATGDQRVTVHMDENRQTLDFSFKAEVTALRIDPEFDVFRRLSRAETPAIFRDVTLSGDTKLVLPGASGEAKTIARGLAARVLQLGVHETDPSRPSGKMTMVVGLDADVETTLGFPLPAAVASPSDGRAFVHLDDGRTWLVVMARDVKSVARLARAGPHYKGRSYIVLQSGNITAKGVWDVAASPLARTFP